METPETSTGNNAAVEGGATATTGVTMPAPLVGGDPPTPEPTPAPTPEPKLDADGKPIEEPKLGPDGKPIEEKPPTKAPEEYADFTIPEGTTLDETTATEFKTMAKELDLTQEQAQKLLDFGGGKLRALAEGPYKAWSELQTKWQAEVKADPDIGGMKMEASLMQAAAVFVPGESNPFVGSEAEAKSLKDALNTTGAGNNPAIVKMFVKIGRMLAEPASLTGKPPNTNTAEARLDKAYPTMTEQLAGQS